MHAPVTTDDPLALAAKAAAQQQLDVAAATLQRALARARDAERTVPTNLAQDWFGPASDAFVECGREIQRRLQSAIEIVDDVSRVVAFEASR